MSEFKCRYCGEETQHSIRTKLEFGSYRLNRDVSMAAYVVKSFREVQRVSTSPTIREVISKLDRHSNEKIYSTILWTLNGLLGLLGRFDKTGSVNAHQFPNKGRVNDWRNKSMTNSFLQPNYAEDRINPNRRNYKPSKNKTWRRPEGIRETAPTNVLTIATVESGNVNSCHEVLSNN